MVRSPLIPALTRVVAYAAVFGEPVNFRQAWRYLPQYSVSWSQFRRELPKALPDPQLQTWIKPQVVGPSARTWKSVSRLLGLVPWLPGLHSVWITGSVAAGSPLERDIDLLIVTKPGRLWLTRLLVVAVARMLGTYRTRQERGAAVDLWCCNLWLEPATLSFAKRQSLYVAREIIQAIPIYESCLGNSEAFIRANVWVADWLPNGYRAALRRAQQVYPWRPWFLSFVPSGALYAANHLLQRLQWRWMERHRTRERISATSAFFHPRPTATWVSKRYETICQSLGVSPWPDTHT